MHVLKIRLGLMHFMVALWNRADHYIFALWFLLSFLWPPCVADADIMFCLVVSIFFLFFPLPNLSGRRVDVGHTSTHGVALVRI